jgi:2-polyprenyl-3-methyl-5-hydroxy-6-metoxy-1,4-benzoquinol methylase
VSSISVNYVCPADLHALRATDEALVCGLGCQYPIDDQIPRFVRHGEYTRAFGLQWRRYRQTQLDSHSGVPITERRIRRTLGEALWNGLQGKQVLEAGCGAGRFTEILLNRGAIVSSIDLSEAVDANAENFPPSDTHTIAQADILHLPFANEQFDLVLCQGVIQHTPSPEAAITALFNQVRPGGWFVFDHYTPHPSYYTKTALPLRLVLKRLDPEVGLKITEKLVELLHPLHQRSRRRHWQQALLSRVSPVVAYFHAYPELSDQQQFEWSLLDTHDSLTDFHRHLRWPSQTRRLLASLGARIERCERRGYVVEGRVQRVPSHAYNWGG